MKHFLFALLLALASASALSAPLAPERIAGMASQIDAVMNARLCAVANDTSSNPGLKIKVPLETGGVRLIEYDVYNRMRLNGYAVAPDGRWKMTVEMEETCTADGDGDYCIAFRSYFSRFNVSLRPPGRGVPKL